MKHKPVTIHDDIRTARSGIIFHQLQYDGHKTKNIKYPTRQ